LTALERCCECLSTTVESSLEQLFGTILKSPQGFSGRILPKNDSEEPFLRILLKNSSEGMFRIIVVNNASEQSLRAPKSS